MRLPAIAFALATLMAAPSQAFVVADEITYDLIPFTIDIVFADDTVTTPVFVTGSVTTDGTLGEIQPSAVLSATAILEIGGQGGEQQILNAPQPIPQEAITATDVTILATESDLTITFGDTGTGELSFSFDVPFIVGTIPISFGFEAGSVNAFVDSPEGFLPFSGSTELTSGDSLTIASNTAVIPLPAGAPLLLGGLVIFGLVARRRAA